MSGDCGTIAVLLICKSFRSLLYTRGQKRHAFKRHSAHVRARGGTPGKARIGSFGETYLRSVQKYLILICGYADLNLIASQHHTAIRLPSDMSKIDVHAHVVPPIFREALQNAGGDPAGWHIPLVIAVYTSVDLMDVHRAWTAEEAIAVQDKLGVKTSVLSVTSPGEQDRPSSAWLLAELFTRVSFLG